MEKIIEDYHKPEMVDTTKAPNENIITLLFNDGEICTTKGGHAFLQRSLFPQVTPIKNIKTQEIKFPKKYDGYTYIITESVEKAKEARCKIEELLMTVG